MGKIMIMGMGDVLKGDYGAGCAVLEKMAETVSGPDIDFAWVGTQTLGAAGYLMDADLAVITGALDLSGVPGTLHVWDEAVFDQHAPWMAGQFPDIRGLVLSLTQTRMADAFPSRLVFIWMDPHCTRGYGLSELMNGAVIRAVWQIHREIWQARLAGPPLPSGKTDLPDHAPLQLKTGP